MSSDCSALAAQLDRGSAEDGLIRLYGSTALDFQRARYRTLLDHAAPRLGPAPCFIASAPGRTELGGNHTDHNNGRVLAGAVDFDCIAAAAPNREQIVTLFSDNRAEPIIADLRSLAADPREHSSSEALIRGMAAARQRAGKAVCGFTAVVDSTCRPGTGLSSSAAFSVLIGGIFSLVGGDTEIDPVQLARDGQYAENRYFGKPSGLMDQLSSSVGSTLGIDFMVPHSPHITRLDFEPESWGYRLLVIDTGGNHLGLTAEYAAVTEDIAEAAAVLKRGKARGVTIEEVLDHLPEIRAQAGDRALLRLLHFISEDERAARQLEALQHKDFDTFLALVRESGESSCALLQNCAAAQESREQGIMVARALSRRFFPDSVCRVHGGGFAGTVQSYIPAAQFDAYRDFMERVFGDGAVLPLRVGRPGFCSFTGSGWRFPEAGSLRS